MNDIKQNDALINAIKEVERKFGKETFNELANSLEVIDTGSVFLNEVLGTNGFPKGRIIEIYGSESSGKTTIALSAVKQCLAKGGNVAYIDAENALDSKYVSNLGIDTKSLLVATPLHGEQAFSIIDALLKTRMMDLIVVDSVAALVPKVELDGDISDQNMGLHARLMSKGLRMIQHEVAKSNTCVIFINQTREKIGTYFGSNQTTTGGVALKFYASMRLEVRRSELIKSGDEIVGIRSKINLIKNKLASPFQTCFVDIYFNKGFDPKKEIIDYAIERNIIQKSGSWYYLNDTKLAQGKANLMEYFDKKENHSIYENIKNEVLKS